MPTFEVGSRKHIKKKREYRVRTTCVYIGVQSERVKGFDRQAESTATQTLASCVLLLLLVVLLLFWCGGRTATAVDVVHQSVQVVAAPAARKKLFLLDETCEM